jgi:hypothetical protein
MGTFLKFWISVQDWHRCADRPKTFCHFNRSENFNSYMILGLFTDTVSTAEIIASNEMERWKRIVNKLGFGRRRWWTISRYLHSVWETRENHIIQPLGTGYYDTALWYSVSWLPQS